MFITKSKCGKSLNLVCFGCCSESPVSEEKQVFLHRTCQRYFVAIHQFQGRSKYFVTSNIIVCFFF